MLSININLRPDLICAFYLDHCEGFMSVDEYREEK